MSDFALCLLSGGFDSTAALIDARDEYPNVQALTFHYGQPMRDAEECAAGRAAHALGVKWSRAVLADTLRGGLLSDVQDHSAEPGTNAAFIPARNLVFLATALAHAMVTDPAAGGYVLFVGFCLEDAAGFPDCSAEFVASASKTLTLAAGKRVTVRAPWVRTAKAKIWKHIDPTWWDLLEETWSCYRGQRSPCGTCTACVLRARAFAGHQDRAVGALVMGGDVHRDARIKPWNPPPHVQQRFCTRCQSHVSAFDPHHCDGDEGDG